MTINKRSRKTMTDYLVNHFRYNTMNSWNNATSYAKNVKLHKVIPNELQDAAYEIYEQGDVFDDINDVIQQFDSEHDYAYQAGFNGRSGGYLVLYQGGRNKDTHTSRCNTCRIRTWYQADKPCAVTDCGGTLKAYEGYTSYVQAGIGMDMDNDFTECTMQELKNRVRIVESFDALCADIVNIFIDYCKRYTVIEEQIEVPKTIKVLQEK